MLRETIMLCANDLRSQGSSERMNIRTSQILMWIEGYSGYYGEPTKTIQNHIFPLSDIDLYIGPRWSGAGR